MGLSFGQSRAVLIRLADIPRLVRDDMSIQGARRCSSRGQRLITSGTLRLAHGRDSCQIRVHLPAACARFGFLEGLRHYMLTFNVSDRMLASW